MANSAASDGLSYFAQDLKLPCFPDFQWEDIESSFAILVFLLGMMSNHFMLEGHQMLSMSCVVCLRHSGSCPVCIIISMKVPAIVFQS